MPRSRAEMIEHVAEMMGAGEMIVIIRAGNVREPNTVTVDANISPSVATHLLKHGYRNMLERYGDAEEECAEHDCPYRGDGDRLPSD